MPELVKKDIKKAKENTVKMFKMFLVFAILMVITDMIYDNYDITYQSPIVIERRKNNFVVVEEHVSPVHEEVEEVEEPTEPVEEVKQTWTGEASYYSFDGCVGCNPQRVMANGEILDDMKKTLAFNQLPLNTKVVVTNLSNGFKTTATVTDTGGFERLGRIADLSVATKKTIGCNDLCQVRIESL